jgi:MoaA/NifB/PqqE/SkfB family radical SAM enzyme
MRKEVFFRPEWTCGRYVQNKHAAIYYNLITGMCYTFEGVSADLMGYIFNRPRNSSFDISDITASLKLPLEDVLAFLSQLTEIGLISHSPITKEGVARYRSCVAKERRSNHQVPTKIQDRLPFEHNNAEMEFANNVGGINSVMLELTYNCSEKCVHCYNIGATRNDEETNHRGDLPEIAIEDYRRIIDQLYDQGLFKVCLSGGDPFSKPIVWDIIQYLYDKDIAFDVYTNGQRLDGKESRLADFYPRLVAVSIYSAIPEVHDYITRTKGSLECSLRVMTRLGELSVPMNLKCCIMRPNMKTYYTVIGIADAVGAVPQFEVSITDSIDGDSCATRYLRLKENELEVILRDTRVPLYVGPEVPGFGRGNRDDSENACGAGYNSYCIRPDGKMIACCSFHKVFGDLTVQSVEEILSDSTSLKEWQALSVKDYDECGTFDYCPYCNLCPGNNYSQNGDPTKASENNCFIARVRYGLSIKLKSGIDILDGKSVEDKIQEFEFDVTPLRRIKG